jgi:hypothetical protein
VIIYSDDSGPIIWPDTDKHDPSSEKDYTISYRPQNRVDSKEYVKGVDIVIPITSNGCMYVCVSGGISASSPPTFGTTEGGYTDDGTVRWQCKPLVSKLLAGDTITLSTWTGDVGVTQSDPAIINDIATITKVTVVPATAKTFTITNHITVLRASGRTEKFSKSIVVGIKTL